MEPELKELIDKLDKILDEQPSHELVTFSQALILSRRGVDEPSESDFNMSRTIAFGIAQGLRFAEKIPGITVAQIEAIVLSNVTKAKSA